MINSNNTWINSSPFHRRGIQDLARQRVVSDAEMANDMVAMYRGEVKAHKIIVIIIVIVMIIVMMIIIVIVLIVIVIKVLEVLVVIIMIIIVIMIEARIAAKKAAEEKAL